MTAPEERPDGHPDLADLEALRTGEAPPEVARHVAGCDECRAALEEIKALAPGLASIEAPAVEIPAEIDRRVAAAIDERVAEIRPPRRRRKIVRWAVPLAAAAAVLLAVGIWGISGSRRGSFEGTHAKEAARAGREAPHTGSHAATPAPGGDYDYLRKARELRLRGDMNGSGTVDILDAYELARALRTGRPGLKHWDFNRDGRVDHADVDVIARRAVSVSRGGA